MDRVKYKIEKRYKAPFAGDLTSLMTMVAGVKGAGIAPGDAHVQIESTFTFASGGKEKNSYLATFIWEEEE